MADTREDAANLAVLAFLNRDLKGRPIRGTALNEHAGASRAALGEVDALADFLDGLILDAAWDLDEVALLHAKARVSDALGKLAVARHQDQTLGLLIEAPHGKNPSLVRIGNEIDGARPCLFLLVRADHASRLVQEVVPALARIRSKASAVHVDHLGGRIDLGTEFGHDQLVDQDFP
ncbi:MAG: hypothetical protein ACJA2W_000063 [Planctomycetota bacterium]